MHCQLLTVNYLSSCHYNTSLAHIASEHTTVYLYGEARDYI